MDAPKLFPVKKFETPLLVVWVATILFVVYTHYMTFTIHSCKEEEPELRPYITQGGYISCDMMGVKPPAKVVVTQANEKHYVYCKCGE